MTGLPTTATLSMIVVCLISLLGFRMVGRYGLWNNSPDPLNDSPLTQAMMTIHCSKEVELFGRKYIFPIDREVNCSSDSWKGRNIRTTLCKELARLEKKMSKVGDVDGFDKDWRTAPITLRKICRSIQNHYVLLKSGFFVLGRINGTWQMESFDFQCPTV